MRLLPVLLAAVLCAPAPRAAVQSLADQGALVVEAEAIDGARWWTVQGEDVPLERLLAQIARKSGFRLEGLASVKRGALVTVDLRHRPLELVLEYVLGSLGLAHELDADRLLVLPVGAENDSEELLEAAAAAWIRATSRFPAHPQAAAARLAQGELAELRGLEDVANDHYLALVETFPGTREAAEALLRSGRIYGRLGEWSEASVRFRELASVAEHEEFHAPARLELARCLLQLGNGESARFLLDNLDSEYPAPGEHERIERVLLRAEVLNSLGRPMDALRLLDHSTRELDPVAGHEVLRVRARSLEGVGMPAEAARAWLLYADKATREERRHALEQAARLSLASGDELGVLFIRKEAEPEARTAKLDDYWHEARQRLGLEERPSAAGFDVVQRIETGEALLEDEETERAHALFEALFAQRATLDEELSSRVVTGWARCVEAQRDLNAGIAVLREARPTYASIEARRRLDLAAAKLFERHEHFDLSIEAYRGIYPLERAGAAAATVDAEHVEEQR